MTEQKNKLAQLFAACWKDEALKARLMSDPKAVLKEHGLNVPDDLDVKFVEDADETVHITLPAPPAEHEKLSDAELSNAAGGTTPLFLPAVGVVAGVSQVLCADVAGDVIANVIEGN